MRALAAAAAAGWSALLVSSAYSRRAIRQPVRMPATADAAPISVIVPARDEARDIGQTLRLLRAQRDHLTPASLTPR